MRYTFVCLTLSPEKKNLPVYLPLLIRAGGSNRFDAVRSHFEKNFNFISAVSVISFGATSSVYFCVKIYEEYKNSVMTIDIMKEKLRSMEALSALEMKSVKEKLILEIKSVKEKLTLT